jgi:hypothetical protein
VQNLQTPTSLISSSSMQKDSGQGTQGGMTPNQETPHLAHLVLQHGQRSVRVGLLVIVPRRQPAPRHVSIVRRRAGLPWLRCAGRGACTNAPHSPGIRGSLYVSCL